MGVIREAFAFFISPVRSLAAVKIGFNLNSVGPITFWSELCLRGLVIGKNCSDVHPFEIAASCPPDSFIFSGTGELVRKVCKRLKGFLALERTAKTDFGTLMTGGKKISQNLHHSRLPLYAICQLSY